MKAELRDNFIWIDGENEEETHFLEVLDKNGMRVSGRSTRGLGITSPHIAGLRQLFVNREQQTILGYTLGMTESQLILKTIAGITMRHFTYTKNTEEIARNITDLKDQLFIKPEPMPPIRLTAPRPSKPPPTIPPEKKEEKE